MSSIYDELREAAELNAAPRRAPARPLVRVDLSTSSIAAEADRLWEALEPLAAEHEVDLMQVGTLGLSWLEPVVEVERPGLGCVVYGPVRPEDAAEFLRAALSDHPAEQAAPWLIGARTPAAGVPPLSDHPFWGPQERRLMRVMGIIDPESIDEAIAEGAYAALDRAVAMDPMAICDLVLSAGVGGGAGADSRPVKSGSSCWARPARPSTWSATPTRATRARSSTAC